MKKTLLLLLLCSNIVLAQDKSENIKAAFAESYANEYQLKYDDAIKNLVTVYDANSYEINMRLGWLSYSKQNYADALVYYKKASALMPLSIDAKLGLIYPYSAQNNWDAVRATYIDILKIDPKNSNANYNLGLSYYYANKLAEAEKCFQVVVNLYPMDYNSLLMLAWTYYKQNRMREAKIMFNKVLLVQPSDASALEGLGLIK